MKLPRAFYKDLHELRDKYGKSEPYSRDDLLPATVGLIRKYAETDVSVYVEAARKILDGMDSSDDKQGLSPHFAHVALGETIRIRPKSMKSLRFTLDGTCSKQEQRKHRKKRGSSRWPQSRSSLIAIELMPAVAPALEMGRKSVRHL